MFEEIANNLTIVNDDTPPPVIVENIETWKLNVFKDKLATMQKSDFTSGNHTVSVPCPCKHCRNTIVIWDKRDLEEIAQGRRVCHFCKEHNGESEAVFNYKKHCPKIFLTGKTKTDISKLPPAAYSRFKHWGETFHQTNSSFYISGESGTCKSRMMFLILYHSIIAKGKNYRIFRGGELRETLLNTYAQAYDSTNRRGELVQKIKDQLRTIDVLIFDDFGQDSLTDTMLSDLWTILDYRFSDGKPTVFLSNISPQGLKTRYGKVFSMESMVRRIEEFCEIVRT